MSERVEISDKGLKEIENLRAEINYINTQIAVARKERDKVSDRICFAACCKGINKLDNNVCAKEDRIRGIETTGFSSAEWRGILKESDKFTTIESERGLGYRGTIKVGNSAIACGLIKVDVCSYSNFMRNVKGCSSMANKRYLNTVVRLTKDQYEDLLNKGRTIRTCFMGTEEKVVPILSK